MVSRGRISRYLFQRSSAHLVATRAGPVAFLCWPCTHESRWEDCSTTPTNDPGHRRVRYLKWLPGPRQALPAGSIRRCREARSRRYLRRHTRVSPCLGSPEFDPRLAWRSSISGITLLTNPSWMNGRRGKDADSLFPHPFLPARVQVLKIESKMTLEHILLRFFRVIVVQKCAKSIPSLRGSLFAAEILAYRPCLTAILLEARNSVVRPDPS